MNLEAVIGLEIHAQINTATKMFCSCSNDSFGKAPNVNVCPVCMGFPGLLPVINEEAVHKGVRAALALNCQIAEFCKFDRKNYFYPDSPKGFQISQFDQPLSFQGFVDCEITEFNEKKIFRVRISRLHLEDDAGKLTHVRDGSLVDFNRAGCPLMEIVSEPDLRSQFEAVAYAKEVQKILRYVGSSEADMEKGMMRFDASVSVRPSGEDKLYPRAEIKNLNSFRSLEAAVAFEISRQKSLWEKGTPLVGPITVGWNEDEQKTFFMREKEESDDYRYFPEPDLPPLYFDFPTVEKYRSALPEMPAIKKNRYLFDLGLSEDEANLLVGDLALANYFEKVFTLSGDLKKSLSFVLTVLLKYLNEDLVKIDQQNVSPEALAELIQIVEKGEISATVARNDVFPEMYASGKSAREIVDNRGLKQVSDSLLIEQVAQTVLDSNPKSVSDFKAGKEKALGFLVGQVMKEMKGQANPQMANEIIRKLLQ